LSAEEAQEYDTLIGIIYSMRNLIRDLFITVLEAATWGK